MNVNILKGFYMMSESDYQAQYDAETLANAEQIKSDSNRLKSAQLAAQKKSIEQKQKADAMMKVAGKSVQNETSLNTNTKSNITPGAGNKVNIRGESC